MRIVQLESESLVAEVRRPAFPHEWVEYGKTLREQVVERLSGATVALINKVQIDAEVLDRLPDLKMIAVAATGTNCVDLAACKARGIVVSNIRGYAVHTVPEHVMALLLALSRNLVAWRETLQAGGWQKSGQWCFFDHPIRDLHGATLGLIGSGTLGNGVARLAEAFGMRVLRAERKEAATVRPGHVAFAEVLAQADAISLHCPLTDDTRGLIGEAELRAMKPTVLLINTARGGIVDESALIRALKEGWIAGAGFDVLTVEPPPEGHPMVDPALLALPNFLLTPHVAWSSRPAMQALADQLIDNVEAFAAGLPKNRVA
ncbi:MAG: D-2-hydroxyacid dehydrogenase [Betaproteobacteria bacterium]|nr:D-2-hydroxyacid dehydrogenase [Betaproteobacteria bacterium]